jgi:hypothetical protein
MGKPGISIAAKVTAAGYENSIHDQRLVESHNSLSKVLRPEQILVNFAGPEPLQFRNSEKVEYLKTEPNLHSTVCYYCYNHILHSGISINQL